MAHNTSTTAHDQKAWSSSLSKVVAAVGRVVCPTLGVPDLGSTKSRAKVVPTAVNSSRRGPGGPYQE